MTTDSPEAGYVMVGAHEAIAPAAPGSYGFPAARRELMLLLGPLMVAAIVVFPRVQSAGPVASHAVLVRRDGRPGFRLAAPPLDPALLESVVALAQLASGAPTFWCTTAVLDTEVAWRLRFPQLTGAPGADNPSAWRPPLPLLGAGA